MQITDVRIRLTTAGRVRSTATITIDNCLMIRGLRVIRTRKGYSVEMPRRRQQDGTYLEFAAPTNAETRTLIEEAVLTEFEKVSGEQVTRRGSR